MGRSWTKAKGPKGHQPTRHENAYGQVIIECECGEALTETGYYGDGDRVEGHAKLMAGEADKE